jgi:flagellar biosynthesis chaperone FliJ
MKIPKAKFMGLAHQSHDFAEWMMSMSLEQLLFFEKKRVVMNGNAKERLEALMKNRPEIMENVSSKIIASYIGITQSYLSTLKKEFARELKKR